MKVEASAQAVAIDRQAKALRIQHQSEFQHRKYMFMHKSDHDGVVRIFVGYLWGGNPSEFKLEFKRARMGNYRVLRAVCDYIVGQE